MKNDGTAAEKAFFNHWSRKGHIQRLRDKKDLMGLNGGARVADFSKPSDFLVSSSSDALHYAEVKSTTHKTRFEFKCIRPAQLAAARMEAKRGHKNYVFYIFSFERGQWYQLDCCDFVAYVDVGMKSIEFEDLRTWNLT
jgi:hypothetical protein